MQSFSCINDTNYPKKKFNFNFKSANKNKNFFIFTENSIRKVQSIILILINFVNFLEMVFGCEFKNYYSNGYP